MTVTTHVKALTVALAVALAASLLLLVGPLAQPADTQTAALPPSRAKHFRRVSQVCLKILRRP
jgi:hypothetical protein